MKKTALKSLDSSAEKVTVKTPGILCGSADDVNDTLKKKKVVKLSKKGVFST